MNTEHNGDASNSRPCISGRLSTIDVFGFHSGSHGHTTMLTIVQTREQLKKNAQLKFIELIKEIALLKMVKYEHPESHNISLANRFYAYLTK